METIEKDGLCCFRGGLAVTHGIFTRLGGVSPAPFNSLNTGGSVGDEAVNVRTNHQRMYDVLGVDGTRAASTWQIHGAEVIVAQEPFSERSWQAQADGIITDQVGLSLVMRFADCLPLLYHDPVRGAIGLAHAGWRGTVAGMAEAMVAAMQSHYGTRPQDLEVLIGPGISQAHFQVGEEVVVAMTERFGSDTPLVRRDPVDGTAYVDLWAANRRALVRAGVQRIEVMELCTYERTDLFFSHRAEKGRTGRFGVVICL